MKRDYIEKGLYYIQRRLHKEKTIQKRNYIKKKYKKIVYIKTNNIKEEIYRRKTICREIK